MKHMEKKKSLFQLFSIIAKLYPSKDEASVLDAVNKCSIDPDFMRSTTEKFKSERKKPLNEKQLAALNESEVACDLIYREAMVNREGLKEFVNDQIKRIGMEKAYQLGSASPKERS